MCGRYYIDDETDRAIEKLVRSVDRKLKLERTRDVRPSEMATVILQQEGVLQMEQIKWGFPSIHGKGLLINARAEGAMEKPTFQDSIRRRRCVIPARGFYEWNQHKEKYCFERQEKNRVLYMAGCFQAFQGENRFVILTTNANESVARVHDRMPLVLQEQEIGQWLRDDSKIISFLQKRPPLLEGRTDYSQISFLSNGSM